MTKNLAREAGWLAGSEAWLALRPGLLGLLGTDIRTDIRMDIHTYIRNSFPFYRTLIR